MLNFSQPYSASRSAVCADNIVCSSQPLATQAGIDAMRRGGNAVDAALATAITLTVVEPCMNGVGSDAFAIIWDGNQLRGLNASGRAPVGWDVERFAGRKRMPALGWDSVTVPGAVSAWVELSKTYGNLAFDELFECAIKYAREGFPVGPITADVWQRAAPNYSEFEEFNNHFLPAPQPGERFQRPDLVATLEAIARTRGEDFYRGELAAKIVAASSAAGGVMSLADLDQHQADWVDPIEQGYRTSSLHEIPPNGQGLAAQIALAILAHFDIAPLDSAASIHLEIEAMKIAIRAAFDHFSDPRTMRISPEELLGSDSIAAAAATIGDQASSLPPVVLPMSHDTVYLATADASGMMVSFIQSNYLAFGSGIVIPGTGIAMQNRGAGFSLEPGHANQVGPGKRPFHTIIPGFASENGSPSMAFGVMGGHMQAQGHVQMMRRVFDHNQNPQAASDAPRWIVNQDFSVGVERTMPPEIVQELEVRGHKIAYDDDPTTFGGAQLIYKNDQGYVAGSDHRKEGCAAGF